MWLLPLVSGFACGCFTGSLRVSGPLGSLAVAATGGFGIWILSFYLLPKIPEPPNPSMMSTQELQKLLGDRYAQLRRVLDTEENKAPDRIQFAAFRARVDVHLRTLEDAISRQDMIRVHDATKELVNLLDSDDAKKALSPEGRFQLLYECFQDYPVPSLRPPGTKGV